MGTTTLNIPVDSELARFFKAASADDQRKILKMLTFWLIVSLRELATTNQMSLSEFMDSISAKAQARGLTPEILESLLDDDE
jgi:hypothetical protein